MKKHIVIALYASLVYLDIWMYLAYPYRPFPSDDVWVYYPSLTMDTYDALSVMPYLIYPVLRYSLLGFKQIWTLLSSDALQTLLFSAVISNSVTLFLSALIVFKITRSMTAMVIYMALYSTSAWPANYYFFYTHAPWDAMIVMLIFFCIIGAYINPDKRNILVSLSGVISGIMFWSAPQAAFIITLFIIALACLFRPLNALYNRKVFATYATSLWCGLTPLLFSSTPKMVRYLCYKGHWSHPLLAYKKFGFIPRLPLLGIFYLIKTYGTFLCAAFVAISILFFAEMLIKYLTRRETIEYSVPERIITALLAFVWLYILSLTFWAFHKFGRLCFPVYPVILISVICITHRFLKCHRMRYRCLVIVILVCAFAYVIATNVILCSQIMDVRKIAPAYLNNMNRHIQFYVLADDPHAEYIQEWLRSYNVQRIKICELDSPIFAGRRIGLIIGPHGTGSGTSILAHACLDDFSLESLNKSKVIKRPHQRIILPYFAYFPTFLLEEENCQALYLMGKTPDYKSDSKNLTLLLFDEQFSGHSHTHGRYSKGGNQFGL